jgi:MYXO-CTERM domain-containing protein
MQLNLRLSRSLPLLLVLCLPGRALAAPWEDATDETIGATAEWSNKVELADINGDGLVDILLANGAGYNEAEGGEQNRAFLNKGPGMPFEDVSEDVFGVVLDQTRVIKARDVDGDGNVDLVIGNNFGEQSALRLGDGMGGFTDATDQLPQGMHGFGDLELGDVDGDGDLDIVAADWGPGAVGEGETTKLWVNDGAGNFTDVTAAQMPAIKIAWSWEMELADVDNDYDLDVLVSCKSCSGSFLFHNDGAGKFTDATDQLPQFANNYEFEAIDLNGDDFVDLITINDGPMVTEHIFIGDGMGGFEDATAELWPAVANIPGDDNMVAFLDYESDGDADFVVCGLFGGEDRLLINDGMGNLSLEPLAFLPATSSGSLGIAIADLDGDKKIDVAFAEGESPQDADRVFLGVDVAADTAAPKLSLLEVTTAGTIVSVRGRIHDNKTPVMPHDFTDVSVTLFEDGNEQSFPLTWYGEALWRADIDIGASEFKAATVCATDAAGNEACSEQFEVGGGSNTTGDETSEATSAGTGPATDGTGDPTSDATGDATSDTPTTDGTPTSGDATGGLSTGADESGTSDGQDDDGGGCGCRSSDNGGTWLLALGALLLAPRRRRR